MSSSTAQQYVMLNAAVATLVGSELVSHGQEHCFDGSKDAKMGPTMQRRSLS